MTEEEKIFAGKMFDPRSEELRQIKHKAHEACRRYNTLDEYDPERQELMRSILGSTGKTFYFQGPVQINYGSHTFIGENFFANYNCVILDCAPVTFGDNVFIAPNCGFYTAGHPLDYPTRNALLEFAKPITVGDNVWIGGNVVVLPGVTIGSGSVIGAGSVVSRDIPENVLAVGNPCRPIRSINPEDRRML